MTALGSTLRQALGRRIPVQALAHVLLVAVLCLCYLPIYPHMPMVGIDPSWAFGMNHAAATQMRIGHDLVFTFGPLAGVYTQLYHPGTHSLNTAFSALLGAAAYLAFVQICRGHALPLLLCAAAVAVAAISRDALLFLYPLAAVLATTRQTLAHRSTAATVDAAPRHAGSLAHAAVLAPLGILPLVKASLLPLCVLALLLSMHALWRRKTALTLLALACVPVATAFAAWMLAGQRWDDLPRYIASIGPITSGYAPAMGLDAATRDDIVAFLLAAGGLVVAGLGAGVLTHADRRAALLMLAGCLFVIFKASFVRHDAPHVVTAVAGLPAVGLLWAAHLRSKRAALAAGLALACTHVITLAAPAAEQLASRNAERLATALGSRLLQMQGQAYPNATRFEIALKRIAAAESLPAVAGPADIYPFDQAVLLANGAAWQPRPVFQSYSAYTESLALRNRQHLLGPAAPEHVFFRIETTDGRLPALDDGASWPALWSRYEAIGSGGRFLHWRQRPSPERLPDLEPVHRLSARLGAPVALPHTDGDGWMWAQIDVRPTLAGRIAAALYKPPALQLDLLLADGSRREFRFLADSSRAGFLLSPVVMTTEDFAALGSDQPPPSRRVVRSIVISSRDASFAWQDAFELQLSRWTIAPKRAR